MGSQQDTENLDLASEIDAELRQLEQDASNAAGALVVPQLSSKAAASSEPEQPDSTAPAVPEPAEDPDTSNAASRTASQATTPAQAPAAAPSEPPAIKPKGLTVKPAVKTPVKALNLKPATEAVTAKPAPTAVEEIAEPAASLASSDDKVDDEAAAAAPKLKKPKAVKLAVAKPKAAAASSQTPGKAFNAFSDEMSAQLKETHPDLSFQEIKKRVHKSWMGMSADNKAAYETHTAAEEPAAAAPKKKPAVKAAAKRKAATDDAAAPKAPRAKTGYMFFMAAQRPRIKSENPEATFGELGKLAGAEWKAMSEEQKQPYMQQQEEDKARIAADPAAAAAAAKPKAAKKPRAKPAAKSKAAKQLAEASAEEDADEDLPEAAAPPDLSDDDAERENMDWSTAPACAILGETSHGKYIVKRARQGHDCYGLVDAQAIKRQKLGGGTAAQAELPAGLTQAMVDDYTGFQASFTKTLDSRKQAGAIDLEELEEDSPLEMMFYLGKLQEAHYPLSKPKGPKGKDFTIKLPVIGLSQAIQRILHVERQQHAAEVKALHAEIAEAKQAAAADPAQAKQAAAAGVSEE